MANISKITLPDESSYDIISKTGRGLVRATMESTSSATAFVITASGITELYDGLTVIVKNTKIASAKKCTFNLNGLGAKRIWMSQDNGYCTTHWGLNQTQIFVYDVTNERWEFQQGRDTNSDTKVRQTLLATDANDRPLLMSYATTETETSNVDNVSYRSAKIYGNHTSGEITAVAFNGDLNGDASSVNGHTVGVDVPSDAVFTDHVYTGTGNISVNASTNVISTTAEVNQNAFSNVKVGSTTVAADTKTDTLELAGSNVTLTPDATNDKVTIGITSSNVTTALGYTPYNSTNPNGYTKVESSTNGKIKINGTDTTVYTHPGSGTNPHGTTAADVGAAESDHTHGNITNGGALQTTDITIASGDKIVVTDASDSNKVARTSTSFDGSTTNKALTPKGTFEDFLNEDDFEILTASGNPVSVTTKAEGYAKSALVTFAPIQDLHGQSAPYPAGGGKNKIGSTLTYIKSANTSGTWSGNNYTLNGVTFAVLVDSDDNVTGIKVTGTASERTDFRVGVPDLVTGTNYIVNGCPANGSNSTYRLTCLYNPSGSAHDRGSGSATFTATGYEETYCYIRIANGYSIATGGLTYYPMVRLATETDTTFAPYSNICPISGRDSVDVVVTGKNLFNATIEQGGIYSSGGKSNRTDRCRTETAMRIKSNTEYTVSVGGDAILTGIYFYISETINALTFSSRMTGSGKTLTFTAPSEGGYVAFTFAKSDTSSDITPSEVIEPMFEFGSTPTAYEPYKGQTHTATFPDTVYGGKIDFVSGKVVITHKFEEYNGTENWALATGTNPYFRLYIIDVTTVAKTIISSQYPSAEVTPTDTNLGVGNTAGSVRFRLSQMPTLDEFKAMLANNPVQVCYELATPTEITLIPADMNLLKGLNTVWSDANGDVTVEYSKIPKRVSKSVKVYYQNGKLFIY